MAQKLMNVRQTADVLGVHENTIRNWEERGILPAVRLPGSGFRRFDPSAVEQMRKEMWAHLAPADEGPVITPRAAISGHIQHGDLED